MLKFNQRNKYYTVYSIYYIYIGILYRAYIVYILKVFYETDYYVKNYSVKLIIVITL